MQPMPHSTAMKIQANPLTDVAGFIFDMDDLLIESKTIWRRSLTRLLEDVGVPGSSLEAVHYRGLSAADTTDLMLRVFEIESDSNRFYQSFVDRLLSDLREHPLVPHAGAVHAVETASHATPVAVASGSPLAVIHSVLSQLGLDTCVDIVVSAEEVSVGKPDPAIFIEAARRIDVAPQECVVFEDSLVGVQAAVSAGTTCIAVPSEMDDQIKRLTPYVYPALSDLPWLERPRA